MSETLVADGLHALQTCVHGSKSSNTCCLLMVCGCYERQDCRQQTTCFDVRRPVRTVRETVHVEFKLSARV